MKKIVVHIIPDDKFTIGYIKYMMLNIKKCRHLFIVRGSAYIKNIDNYNVNNIIIVNNNITLLKEKKKLINCDKVIVSGVFGLEKFLFLLPNSILKKTYLHFWGGDFYSFRNTSFFSKKYVKKIMLHSCIRRCGGIINLIDGDYTELCKIFPNENNHYLMIMPADPERVNIYEKYIDNKDEKFNILLGNSATKENCHIEILKVLEHLKFNDIKIICPLSYGDNEYAKNVIKIGKEIFKEKFVPITTYIEYEDYISLLSTCKVGIFNNNRQQAMGNIGIMLKMGKKVYLRKNTVMWDEFEKDGICIYDVNDLSNISLKKIFSFNEKNKENNIQYMKKREEVRYKTIDIFFDSILK